LICNPDLTDIKWDYVFNILHTSSSKIISFRGNNKSFNQIYWKEIKRYFSVNVPSVYGCFFAIKYDFFKLLNGFNKDYFMYGEEHDLAFRLLSKGYNIHEDLSKCYYRKNTENFKMYNWKLKLRIINNLCTIHSTITGTSKYKILILRFAYDFYFLVKNFKLNLFPFLLNANLLSINQLNINRLRRHVIQSRG
jgi:GT2 family glycosyltransferase